MAQIPRMVRIVDDMCVFDQSIEEAFWHAWDVLETCAKNGIVLNKEKFQFCSRTINFAGLTVTPNGVQPSEKILRAIKDFPPPNDLTQARAFFGLINQVQWAYANSSKMSPFRELVKPNSTFTWTSELRKLFEEAKGKILQQVEAGVRQYDITRETCLQTDFSQEGLGYLLLQKYCECSIENAPLCCKAGWRLVFAGSRFTKGAERRYAPTEGEALAVAWALNHAQIFTKGCKNLIIATDHKPLLGILNDRPFTDVKNPRILRLKEHTLQFDFVMKYTKGKWHRAPDALSRNPSIGMLNMFHDDSNVYDPVFDLKPEVAFSEICESSITLEKISELTATDSELSKLKSTILNGFPGTQHDTHADIRPYFNVKEHLWIHDNIIMYKDRIFIPKPLRHMILRFLHAAHQGTDGMRARAANCIYWPGINTAISETRKNCKACTTIAPSQPRQPLQPLPCSQYPFQDSCIDECEIKGHHYLVIADKFSNWLVIFHFISHVQSKHVIESLKAVFQTYGVAERIFSDGGLPLVSSDVRNFLSRWGVQHIISSAHYPQSNGRAELAIKTAKRMLQDNTGPNGSLKTDAVCRALLQYRNTPIKNLGLSPAQLLFHRHLRDALPMRSSLLKPHKRWIIAASNREKAFQERNSATAARYNTFTRDLKPIPIGSRILIQDFKNKKRWNRSGRVVERDDRQYTICVDGSSRVITRNRKFIRPDHATTDATADQFDDFYLISGTTTTDTTDDVHVDNHTVAPEICVSPPPGTQSGDSSLTLATPVLQRNSPQQQCSPIPRMLKELLPHNKAGLKEA